MINPPITEIQAFIRKTQAKKDWSSMDFWLYCKEAIALAKKYPDHKDGIAYEIVEKGRYFADFDTEDTNQLRREVKDLAANLELPDHHVYTGHGLSVKQQWELMEEIVDEAIELEA